MYIVNKNIVQKGARVDPCGTPENIEMGKKTSKALSDKRGSRELWNQVIYREESPKLLSLFNKRLCGTLSRAWLIRK
jgi:hypothetical protein